MAVSRIGRGQYVLVPLAITALWVALVATSPTAAAPQECFTTVLMDGSAGSAKDAEQAMTDLVASMDRYLPTSRGDNQLRITALRAAAATAAKSTSTEGSSTFEAGAPGAVVGSFKVEQAPNGKWAVTAAHAAVPASLCGF